MAQIKRLSPVRFHARILKSEIRENWTVALEYEQEGQGPWLTDLTHKARWDLQDARIGEQNPCGLEVPETPGECTFARDILINRMNGTQASIYHLGADAPPPLPEFSGYTDVTEVAASLAVYGPQAFFLAEKLTNLDLMNPSREAPFLSQGPFCRVPCQIVVLEKHPDGAGGFLLACSRGYAESMVHAIQTAGAEFGLRPAGENRFQHWIGTLQHADTAEMRKAGGIAG